MKGKKLILMNSFERHVATVSPIRTVRTRFLEWFFATLRSVKVRRRERSLQLCETLSLGEKRFVAVVRFERKRFLIGATPHSIQLLDRIDAQSPENPVDLIPPIPGSERLQ